MKQETNTNKYYYCKLKKYGSPNSVAVKRKFELSDLKDFVAMNKIIKNAISNIIKKNDINDYILVLTHPVIENIYIYNKEQWDLYYKYHLIEDCISNKSLKVEFSLEKVNKENTILRENKKNIIQYIIKNLPLEIYFDCLIGFLKEKPEILKEYEIYFLNQIINKNIMPIISLTDSVDDNLEENINIDKLSNNEKNQNNKKNNNNILRYEDFYIHRKDFIPILEERFKAFSKNQKTYEEIIKTFKSETEKDINLKDLELKEEYTHNTSLELNKDKSLGQISLLSNDNNEISNNILYTVLNPPHQYVTKMINEDKYFKKFDKNEYYIGLEDYKDKLNREYAEILIKNS